MRARLFATLLLAATASVSAREAGTTMIVHAGKVVDVDHGPVLVDQAIRIENGKVVRIGPWAGTDVQGAQVVDWSHYTALPGLMDMHTHIADEGQSADPGAPLKSTPARDAFIGARNAWDTVRAGFTSGHCGIYAAAL